MPVNERHLPLDRTMKFPHNWCKLDTNGNVQVWLANDHLQYANPSLQKLSSSDQFDLDKLIPLAAINKQIETSIKNATKCNNNFNQNCKQPNIQRILLFNGIDPITLKFTKTFTNLSGIDKIGSLVDEKLIFWLYNYFQHHNSLYALNYRLYVKIAFDMYKKFMYDNNKCQGKVRKYIRAL